MARRGPKTLLLLLFALGALGVLAGCASLSSPVPQAVRVAPPGNLQLIEALADPERYGARPVRWGGEVVEVRSDAAGAAAVEVLARRLDDEGRPFAGGPSDGRFQIRAAPDVDPELYRTGTAITVAGTLAGSARSLADDRDVPLVAVSAFMNWGPVWIDPPYDWHDPWYWHRRHGRFGHWHHHPYW